MSIRPCRLTSRRSQPPLALSVPLSRFTSRVGGGSAFFVRLPLTLIMNPTQEQIVQALPSCALRSRVFLLQTPAYDLSNKTLAESVYFRKGWRTVALFTPSLQEQVVKRQKLDPNDDDVVSEDYGFQAEALYGAEPKPLLDRFNKRLFHITYSRINEKNEWLMDELLPPSLCVSRRRFIDHVLQVTTIPIDTSERSLWRALKAKQTPATPLQQNIFKCIHLSDTNY